MSSETFTVTTPAELRAALAAFAENSPAALTVTFSLSDTEALDLADALARHPSLTALTLAIAPSDHALAALVDAIARHPALTRVRLGASLPDGLQQSLMAALCRNTGVRRAPSRVRPALAAPPVLPSRVEELARDELAACQRVLRSLALHPRLVAELPTEFGDLRELAGRLLRGERAEHRREQRSARSERLARASVRDAEKVASTGLRQLRRKRRGAPLVWETDTRAETPPSADHVIATLERTRSCYACHEPYNQLHFFYDRLCPACAALNWERRNQSADLRGRTVLLTGARVRIGFVTALKLLRAGANLLATTRFPRDAARRFAAQPDFDAWRDRLTLYALDLRNIPAVERFIAHLDQTLGRLDVLINNAAQTVWRPPAYYEHLRPIETAAFRELPENLRAVLVEDDPTHIVPSLGAPDAEDSLGLFPAGTDDGTGHPLDLRPTNSWRLRPEEVSTRELLEAHTINALAPYLLTTRLRALMARGPGSDRYVVQVSAPEGQFDRLYKSPFHAHTNMAKAALNMLVRTSSEDFARDRIFMCCVDTGWISNQNPHPITGKMDQAGFEPPLDEVDAAARVLDPVFRGVALGENLHGIYVKDYKPAPW